MNGTTFTHTYSWVSIDSVTTYEGLIVFHRSRMPSGIGTCWHLPCYERPWHLSWTYKVLSFPSFQSSKFFKFFSFEAVVMAIMLYPFFFLSQVCLQCVACHIEYFFLHVWNALLLLQVFSALCSERLVCFCVGKWREFVHVCACTAVHTYEYFRTSVYCCLLEQVELGECLCSPGWEVFILLQYKYEYLNLPVCWVMCFWRRHGRTSARLPWYCELKPLLSKQITREFGKPRLKPSQAP